MDICLVGARETAVRRVVVAMGVVFALGGAVQGQVPYVVLHQFAGDCSDGCNPQGDLIQATDGNLYGTTQAGGTSGNGTVFKITTGGTLTTLHSFAADCSDGCT